MNPYKQTNICVERLMREYRTHKRLIVAVDFDDTVFDYHEIGINSQEIVALLRTCKQLGFYIMLFTAAPRIDDWAVQRQYMKDIGCNVDAVNANPLPLPFGHDGKPYYNILLDDRTIVEYLRDIVSSGADQFDAAFKRLMVGLGADKRRQEGVMDVDEILRAQSFDELI